MVRDPVCGMMVNPERAAAEMEHNGKTYYFCLPSCAAAFDRDPDRYTRGENVMSEHAMSYGGIMRRSGRCY